MKRLVREFEFSPEQLQTVRMLAEATHLTETTAGILYARGVDTEDKMRAFLQPSAEHFLSPFLMHGMREAAELITRARNEGWRVAVFGDYDADGIGACAVLSRALVQFGIEPFLFVPERTDGYGLSVRAVDKIFAEFSPELFITVDCGVSCREEVAYIRAKGAEVIVTDHHELPPELPDCIVIDPKIKDDYPYDNLCGAGVAFKLSEALIGIRAHALLDFAALSTVADSVPLVGENRDIVAEGLRRMEGNARPVFSALLGKTSELTAQTLAFSVAPRVNAAGRMGNAAAALQLFTSEDEEEIARLAARLSEYNSERQKYCEELFAEVRTRVEAQGAYGNVIMLAGENWNAGFVGIVAARIAELFSRPTLLFVRRGNMFKGSARSIENVNIFEALRSCSDLITEFGGHAQAAGVNVTEDNFEALRAALDGYIGAHYAREEFLPCVYVAGEGTGDFRRVAHELELLEPYGVGNRRPLFYVEAGRVNASLMKPDSPHVTMNMGGIDFVYFGGAKDLDILKSDVRKQIVFEYNISHFRGKEYVKGFVKGVLYDGATGEDIRLDAFENAVRLCARPPVFAEYFSREKLENFLEERIRGCAYGLCVVTADRGALARYPVLKELGIDVFRLSSGSCMNTVLYAPAPDCDLSAFREVVVIGSPMRLPPCGHAKIIGESDADMGATFDVSCERETLLKVFSHLRTREGLEAESYAEFARLAGGDFGEGQVVFSLAVFEELGLLSTREGRLVFARGKKSDLALSEIYKTVSRIKEG